MPPFKLSFFLLCLVFVIFNHCKPPKCENKVVVVVKVVVVADTIFHSGDILQ